VPIGRTADPPARRHRPAPRDRRDHHNYAGRAASTGFLHVAGLAQADLLYYYGVDALAYLMPLEDGQQGRAHAVFACCSRVAAVAAHRVRRPPQLALFGFLFIYNGCSHWLLRLLFRFVVLFGLAGPVRFAAARRASGRAVGTRATPRPVLAHEQMYLLLTCSPLRADWRCWRGRRVAALPAEPRRAGHLAPLVRAFGSCALRVHHRKPRRRASRARSRASAPSTTRSKSVHGACHYVLTYTSRLRRRVHRARVFL